MDDFLTAPPAINLAYVSLVLALVRTARATLEAAHASLLFQAICERYEKQQSIVLTSNKAFADWSHVFAGGAIMASAALDRLLHRSTVINIRGDIYRLREKRQANAMLPKEVPTQPTI